MIAGSSHSESAAAGQRGHKQEELGLLPARASSNSAKTPEDHFGHVRGTSIKRHDRISTRNEAFNSCRAIFVDFLAIDISCRLGDKKKI